MIIKVIEHKENQSEADAEQLVRYVKGERGMDGDDEKIAPGYGGQSGFDTTDTDRQLLLLRELMRETGSRRPLMHAVIAWEAGERPTSEQVDEAVAIWRKALRLHGLPMLWTMHENTQFMHAHIVTCLVEPLTGQWHDPTFYKRDSQRAKARIEKRQGWRPCDNDLYIPRPDGTDGASMPVEVIADDEEQLGQGDKDIMPNPARTTKRKKRKKKGLPSMPPLRQGASSFEQRTGRKSNQSKAQERILQVWEEAEDWPSFHQLLAAKGMRLVPAERSGYRIEVDGEPVKLTDVLSKGVKALEKKLRAPWEPAGKDVPAPAPPPEEPEPASGMDEELLPWWRQYLAEEVAWKEDSRRQAQAAREEWKRRVAAVLEANRVARKQMKAEIRLATRLVKKARRQGGRLPAGTAEALKLALEERGRKALRPVPMQGRSGRPSWPAFADWLEAKNEAALADAWRHRGSVSPQQAPEPEEPSWPRPGL